VLVFAKTIWQSWIGAQGAALLRPRSTYAGFDVRLDLADYLTFNTFDCRPCVWYIDESDAEGGQRGGHRADLAT
jgi:hypothetical protein